MFPRAESTLYPLLQGLDSYILYTVHVSGSLEILISLLSCFLLVPRLATWPTSTSRATTTSLQSSPKNGRQLWTKPISLTKSPSRELTLVRVNRDTSPLNAVPVIGETTLVHDEGRKAETMRRVTNPTHWGQATASFASSSSAGYP